MRPIDGLNLDVSAGSLAILLGPSGCGKTTLLSCLGGILKPTSGRIAFGDIDVTALDGTALTEYRRNTVGIVFQAFNLVPSLTALENVDGADARGGHDHARAVARARPTNCWTGSVSRTGCTPSRRSAAVASSSASPSPVRIALDPPLILADEPTAHLDFIQVEEVLRLIRELASGERVVVVATHDSRMLPLADRVVELVPHVAATDRAARDRAGRRPDSVLFEQGSMGDLIYVVAEGEFEIVRELRRRR